MPKYDCDRCLKKEVAYGCPPKIQSAYTHAVNTHGSHNCDEFVSIDQQDLLLEIKQGAIKNKAHALGIPEQA